MKQGEGRHRGSVEKRRLSSPKVHSLIAVKVSVWFEIKLFCKVTPSCAPSF